MIPLEQIKVASPCSANWEAMEGNEQARFCQSCQKNVYNLSEMSRAEAEELVTRQEGKLCVRFYTRSDGTVLTQDCPVGVRAARKRFAQSLSWAAALVLSCWSGLLRLDTRAEAVAVAKPHRAAVKAAKPAPKVTPRPLMGEPIASPLPPVMGKPAPVLNPPVMGGIMPPPAPKK